MRRRKATRGRPRKIKRGRLGKLRNGVSFDPKLSEDSLEDQTTTSLKSDDAVNGCIGLDKTGPFSYRVGSVNIELEGAGEDIKPVIQENDIMLEVECGSNTASMFLSRLCQGSKGSCIEFDGAWLTPNEFQFVSGRETAKDWKRSIRHFGRSLKLLITKGIITVHPAACRCDSCRLLSSTTAEPKLVLEQRELLQKAKGGSEGSASGSDKEEDGDRGSDEEGAEDGSEEAEDDSQDGDDDSGSDDGEEEVDEEGKVEENNNEAGDKESSSSSDGSSSGSSSDSDSDDEEEKKDEEEEEDENGESEAKVEIPVLNHNVFEEVSAVAAEAAAAAVIAPEAGGKEEEMEVGEEEKVQEEAGDEYTEEEGEPEEENVVEPANIEETNLVKSVQESERDVDEMGMPSNDDFEKETEDKEPGDTNLAESQDKDQPSPEPVIPPQPAEPSEIVGEYSQIENPEDSANDQTDKSPEERLMSEETQDEIVPPSEGDSVQGEFIRDPVLPKDEGSLDSSSNAPSVDSIGTNFSRRDQSPVPSKVTTPTMSDNAFKKTVERSNSGGGKSRLSNIIDLLRTSKEKETQKQGVPDRPEEKRQEKRPPEVKEVKTPSPLPPKREEFKHRKPEREEMKPTRDEIKANEKAREAMRYPMGRLPFGFPPPDLLERASREAHEQLSKSHRQFEKNLESLIAQNMNPFIPELSIFSLPEHRAQMEYNYLKNMERLDQMAKERMATMAELRHQQLIREHNSFVAKLAEQQQKNQRQEPERPREPVKKPVAAPKRREESLHHSKVPPAHRAMPEVRKDKPDQRTLQTPPAAHHHQPTSRPPSTGSKPPSSLPLPASTARAAHPAVPSATQSRSSPMIAPIAPPLQMWSSCFPYVIPPPTMEMQRLTQFFPNLNGGLFSADAGTKRQTESPILDLSTKKRKMQMDAREHESQSKEPRLSSSSKSVPSSHANGLPRENIHHRSHSNKDNSAKERPVWPGFDRSSALSCTCALRHLNDIRTWSVDDVCCFLKGLEGCTLYVDTFRRNGIDGNTLLLLTPDTLIKTLGMKPGAARFLTDSVSKRARELQKLVPCEYCRMKIQKV